MTNDERHNDDPPGEEERRQLRLALDGCDYVVAGSAIVHQFKGKAIPNELAALLDDYLENPDFDAAAGIIAFDPNLALFFIESKPGGFFMRHRDWLR